MMSKPTIALVASTKFYQSLNRYVQEFEALGFVVHHPNLEEDDEADEALDYNHKKELTLRFLELIDTSDAVFVVADEGYVGLSVTIEIAYAFAKNIPIYTSEELQEHAVRCLTKGVRTPKGISKIIK